MNDTSQTRPFRFFKLGFWNSHFDFRDEIRLLIRDYESDLASPDFAYILRHIADEHDPPKFKK